MTLTRPWAIDTAFPNAADQRKQLAGVYPREGVLPDPISMAVAGIAYAGTAWGINARAFNAVLKRGGAPYSQAYGSALEGNDGVVTGAWTITGAPASGNRVDLLCIRARDTTQGEAATGPMDGPGGLQRNGLPEFVLVTGAAGGATPATPAGYTRIATVTTPSGAASIAGSTIVNDYPFAQVVGGTIVVRTVAERDALVNVLPGDEVYVINTGQAFAYVDATIGWVHLFGKPVISTIAATTIYSAAGARVVEHGGLVRLEGTITSSSANFVAGTYYTIGTIPAAKAPVAQRNFGVSMNGVFGGVQVDAAGSVRFFSTATFTGALNLSLDGSTWLDKRLG